MAIAGWGDDDQDRMGQDGTGGEADDQVGLPEMEQDEALPWLEGEDDYQDESAGHGRIIAIALIGLVAIVAVLGALWWLGRDRLDPELVADGSLIAAPEGDYKERPEDPGGKTFAGSGDASYAVAEGQTREATLASDDVPRPTIQTEQDETVAGVPVQVGAYSNRAGAETGWNTLTRQHAALQGMRYRIVEGQADIGTVYRLQAIAASRSDAEALCAVMRSQGGACQVK